MRRQILFLAMTRLVKTHGTALATKAGQAALLRFNRYALRKGLADRTYTLEEILEEMKQMKDSGALHPREWSALAARIKTIKETLRRKDSPQ